LFHFFTKLLLTPQNVNFFPSIADALDISSWLQKYILVSKTQNQTFELSSKHIQKCPNKARESKKNFIKYVNYLSFQINFPLFCCVSDTFSITWNQKPDLKSSFQTSLFHVSQIFSWSSTSGPLFGKNWSLDAVTNLIRSFRLSSVNSVILIPSLFLCLFLKHSILFQEMDLQSSRKSVLIPLISSWSVRIKWNWSGHSRFWNQGNGRSFWTDFDHLYKMSRVGQDVPRGTWIFGSFKKITRMKLILNAESDDWKDSQSMTDL
jgi:hypothetical protein